jgi:hypothetical protein
MKLFLELVNDYCNGRKHFYLFEIHAHVLDQSETKNSENVEKNFQKMRIFGFFDFEILISQPEYSRLPKNCGRVCKMPNIFTKKVLVTLGQILTEKIHNLELPL